MTPEQQAQLERLVGPDAFNYYDTLPVSLDLAGLLLDARGNVRAVAVQVLQYAAAMLREKERKAGVQAGAPVKSFTAVSGMRVEFGENPASTASRADLWEQQAAQLQGDLQRSTSQRTPGYVAVPTEPS